MIESIKNITPQEYYGWLEIELSKDVLMRLWDYIETAKKNPIDANYKLAGNISKSLDLEDKDNWFFNTILTPSINKFHEYYSKYIKQMSILSEDAPFCLNEFWVNFQKENEFNPIHNHSGIWSFVIWVKIPTDWKEQLALSISANSNAPNASNFNFQYTTMLGDIGYHTYNLGKNQEGTMLFFPAKLMHTVYPFYNCDEERISISGNICFDISENSMRQYRSIAAKREKTFLRKLFNE